MTNAYVHGYDLKENLRLQDQASTLVELLHSDTRYPAGSHVLEAGCGVGAQTVTLARHSPEAFLTSIDISAASLATAREAVAAHRMTNVDFRQADIFDLPFPTNSFDHVFVCFVLEHLARPVEAVRELGKVLKPGGTITFGCDPVDIGELKYARLPEPAAAIVIKLLLSGRDPHTVLNLIQPEAKPIA